MRSPEATASSRLHKRFSEGLFTIIYPLLIAASSPACLQIRMQFGVREACFGAEIEALVPRIISARNAAFPCLADSRSIDSGY